MKNRETYHYKTWYQLVAMMLLALFLSTTVVQLLHGHKKAINIEQSGAEDDSLIGEKCKVCEFYHHVQGKAVCVLHPPVLSIPPSLPVCYPTYYFIGNYKFTLQGFTNKGPPFLLS